MLLVQMAGEDRLARCKGKESDAMERKEVEGHTAGEGRDGPGRGDRDAFVHGHRHRHKGLSGLDRDRLSPSLARCCFRSGSARRRRLAAVRSLCEHDRL